jgi:hypothetical protein
MGRSKTEIFEDAFPVEELLGPGLREYRPKPQPPVKAIQWYADRQFGSFDSGKKYVCQETGVDDFGAVYTEKGVGIITKLNIYFSLVEGDYLMYGSGELAGILLMILPKSVFELTYELVDG